MSLIKHTPSETWKMPEEAPIEYLRRLVSWYELETDHLLQDLPTVEAVTDFFDLQAVYGTDFFEGIMEAIAEGTDPTALAKFVIKHGLQDSWTFNIFTPQHRAVAAAIAKAKGE